MTEKFILDATAGFRRMWFNKEQPNTIYIDQRAECEPDRVMEWKDLSQFSDAKFRLIVFDPPHFIKPESYANQTTIRQYGTLCPETWQSDIKIAFRELWRVLQNYGVLLFKWNDHDITFEKVLALFSVKPLFGQQVKLSRSKHHAQSTMRFTFMKIPEGV
jgi:hypothetical protein